MPALVYMGAAAPCGLERYESQVFGPEYRDNLFVCQFNLRKVSRHVLRPEGSSYVAEDIDFVSSDFVDFHPTDVLMDADGSLLVIDTGGWYKLCCPTSQLWKPDVLGGIYRVRRAGAAGPDDPRGRRIDWSSKTVEQLWTMLADGRAAVRQRATRELVKGRNQPEVRTFVSRLARLGVGALSESPQHRVTVLYDARTAALARVWALSQLESAEPQSLVRLLLGHDDESIRHAAINVVSLHRDRRALPQLVQRLAADTSANRRAASEALGRMGDSSAVPHLLSAAAEADERILQHSITYALIELGDATATRAGLASDEAGTVCVSLIALDQMPGGEVASEQVIPLLESDDPNLRHTAQWLVARHAEWGGDLADSFRHQLAKLAELPETDAPHPTPDTRHLTPTPEALLESMLVGFASHSTIQQLLADTLTRSESTLAAQEMALRVVAQAKLAEPLPHMRRALARVISESPARLLPLAMAAARAVPPVASMDELNTALLEVAEAESNPVDLRVAALAVAAGSAPTISDSQFELLLGALSTDNPVALRSASADAISRAHLTPRQLELLCDAIETAGPLELSRLLAPFGKTADEQLAMKLLSSLNKAAALPSLRVDVVREALAKYSPVVQVKINELESRVNIDAATQRERIEELLPLMSSGDVRRGHAVFHSSKAACSACHRLGYAGGTIGPELTRIGETRTERDLLESILYPSLSFVRSYESVLIVTDEGRTINGTIRDETPQDYILTVAADQEVRVPRAQVEVLQPGTVSIMPAGLDNQLTTQELADLVAFLKDATGR
jgi:putative heme-binding domain-containing protein